MRMRRAFRVASGRRPARHGRHQHQAADEPAGASRGQDAGREIG